MPASRAVPGHISPMLATPVDKPFSDPEWVFETKFDGFRAIAEIRKGSLLLYSRNGLSFKERFPRIVQALGHIRHRAVLDGELVVLNEKRVSDFQKLQHYEQNSHYPLVYFVFDLLSLDGHDLRNMPLLDRKDLLRQLIGRSGIIRYSKHIKSKGEALFRKSVASDLEGIVAKRADSPYRSGVRSRDWLKIKNHQTQEAIIVGFTRPRGQRSHLGSLLLAQYKRKALTYIGRAGTGFTRSTLVELMKRMKPLIIKRAPVDADLSAGDGVTWLRPKLVCEVAYAELTRDGILRHPVYKGLRGEKRARNIRQATERPKPTEKLTHHR